MADNLISKELLGTIIVSILSEQEYSEELKLQIINCLDTGNSYQEDEQASEF